MNTPSEDAIRSRAYELWERDGRPDGKDVDHWLRAARELDVGPWAAPDDDVVAAVETAVQTAFAETPDQSVPGERPQTEGLAESGPGNAAAPRIVSTGTRAEPMQRSGKANGAKSAVA